MMIAILTKRFRAETYLMVDADAWTMTAVLPEEQNPQETLKEVVADMMTMTATMMSPLAAAEGVMMTGNVRPCPCFQDMIC